MPTPSNRTPLRVARGTYTNLTGSISDLQDGEICYATDRNQIYVKEGSTLTNSILDEDDFSSNSDTATATQQSIKTYVTNNAGASLSAANAWTASQRGKVHTISATSTLNIPLDSGQHFIITANGAGTLTFTDLDSDAVGQSGVIYFINGAHTHAYAGHIKKSSSVTIGATAGDYVVPYTVIATDKVVIDVIAVA